jgi:iron complex outermembrane recepter protein
MRVSNARLGISLAVAPLALGLVTAEASYAAENGSTPSISLEEIIVTAQRREERMQETAISIAAFTAQALETKQVRSLDQLTGSIPNLVFDGSAGNTGSNSAASVFIRGVGQGDFVINTDPGVGIYVDGVYLSKVVGSVLDVFDFERIEVLRGPQGTLFGRNTIGGAINITSIKPTNELKGMASVTLGLTQDEVLYSGRASINAPLSDKVFMSASVFGEKQDGWLTAVTSGADQGDRDGVAGRMQVRFLPSETVTIDLAIDGTRKRENGAPLTNLRAIEGLGGPTDPGLLSFLHNALFSGGPCFPPPSPVTDQRCYNSQWTNRGKANYEDTPSKSNINAWGVSGTIAWQLDQIELKSITAFRKLDALFGKGLEGSPHFLGFYQSDYRLKQFSQELQATGELLDGRLKFTGGLYYFKETGSETMPVTFLLVDLLSGGSIKNDNWAAFGQATWSITDQLKLTAGLRYTDETKRFTPDQFVTATKLSGVPVGVRALPNIEERRSISEATPLVTLAYQWTPDAMTYVTYSEGFKSGGFTQRVFPPLPDIPGYDPEFVKLYEGGFKTEWLDRRLRLNGSVFHSDYSDIQVIVFRGIAPTTANAAKARIRGFELELTAALSESLRLEGGMGHLDAKFTELDPQVTEIRLDSRLQNTPSWSINGALDYTSPAATWGTLNARLDWSYTSKVYNDTPNTPELVQPSLHLFNAAMRYISPNETYEVALGVTNLTDKRYITSGFADIGFTGYVEGVWARPRTATLTVKAKF